MILSMSVLEERWRGDREKRIGEGEERRKDRREK